MVFDTSPVFSDMSSPSNLAPCTAILSSNADSSIKSTSLTRSRPMAYFQNNLPWQPDIPDRDHAATFFFRNYTSWTRHSDGLRGFTEILTPLYASSMSASLLHEATHAVALAALSNFKKSAPLRLEARRSYVRALQHLNSAIQNSDIAASDETLMSVLLFSLYEVSGQGCLKLISR